MSNKEISRYLTKEDGTTFSSDTELLGLSVNSKVKNKNSGYTFKKTSSNVFDKTPIEVETNAVLYTSQTLTDAQKTQARNNIGAGKSESVLYTSQTLTDEQKTQARNNIGASSSSAVLYTAQSLTDSQKTQARTNIGAGKAESVLYTEQSLTDAQKLQARTNIGISDLSGVPLGTIVMWSSTEIPTGWSICNGDNGTPDLTGKFVIGVNSVYTVGSTGGAYDHFHYIGFHTGDNSGRFYVNGDIHNDSDKTNSVVYVKTPTKQGLINSITFGNPGAVYVDSEIKGKSAHWNGDSDGGVSDQSFYQGNMITSRGYGDSLTQAGCLPPYYALYYIMKTSGNDSTASGGTAASASQVETLSNLITQLQARIALLESSSSSSGSSGGSGSLTLGNVETMTITLKYSTGSGIVGNKIKAGTILYGRTGYNVDTGYGFNAIEVTNGSYIVVEDSTITNSTTGGGGDQGAINIVTHSVKVRRITGVNV